MENLLLKKRLTEVVRDRESRAEDRSDEDYILKILKAPSKPLSRRLSFSNALSEAETKSSLEVKMSNNPLRIEHPLASSPVLLLNNGEQRPGTYDNQHRAYNTLRLVEADADDFLQYSFSYNSTSPTYLQQGSDSRTFPVSEYPYLIDSTTTEELRDIYLNRIRLVVDPDHVNGTWADGYYDDGDEHNPRFVHQADMFPNPLMIKDERQIVNALLEKAKRIQLQPLDQTGLAYYKNGREIRNRDRQQQRSKELMHYNAKILAGKHFKNQTIDRMINGQDLQFDEKTMTSYPYGVGAMEDDEDFAEFVKSANFLDCRREKLRELNNVRKVVVYANS